MLKITKEEYERMPEAYRGVWSTERSDIPGWEQIRDKHMGKRTMLHYNGGGTTLLVEGMQFEIVDE